MEADGVRGGSRIFGRRGCNLGKKGNRCRGKPPNLRACRERGSLGPSPKEILRQMCLDAFPWHLEIRFQIYHSSQKGTSRRKGGLRTPCTPLCQRGIRPWPCTNAKNCSSIIKMQTSGIFSSKINCVSATVS